MTHRQRNRPAKALGSGEIGTPRALGVGSLGRRYLGQKKHQGLGIYGTNFGGRGVSIGIDPARFELGRRGSVAVAESSTA